MTKILVLKSGGDWYDASAETLVMLSTVDIQVINETYIDWYNGIADGIKKVGPLYKNFKEWLIENNYARETTIDEVEEYWEI